MSRTSSDLTVRSPIRGKLTTNATTPLGRAFIKGSLRGVILTSSKLTPRLEAQVDGHERRHISHPHESETRVRLSTLPHSL